MRLLAPVAFGGCLVATASAECDWLTFRQNVRRWVRSPQTAEQDINGAELVDFAQDVPEDCNQTTSFVAHLFLTAVSARHEDYDLDVWAFMWENIRTSSWRRMIIDAKWPAFGLFAIIFPIFDPCILKFL